MSASVAEHVQKSVLLVQSAKKTESMLLTQISVSIAALAKVLALLVQQRQNNYIQFCKSRRLPMIIDSLFN
jgi:hypothetical protein